MARVFAYSLLYFNPDLAEQQHFQDAVRRVFPGRNQTISLFDAWCAGRTGISDRRRRHARALANRLDAQSRAHGDGIVPHQAFADRTGSNGEQWFWDTLVDADPGKQPDKLAVGGRVRCGCCSVFPDFQSHHPGREVRSERRLCPSLGVRKSPTCRTNTFTGPGRRPDAGPSQKSGIKFGLNVSVTRSSTTVPHGRQRS